ncbi:CPBP family intramembrane glutamic endopeptidase [Paenibacillus solani]|uniref:Abortive infection protein n=1 Tax=Paenibacillus solani TaxID=1705565 RepID=A0A0M1P467_9BACL|nr:type II CAAX endopeptidase family protein [Paenibacillus solani]KOR88829.1 abortive infection protein [Paenibacillus solani]
MLVRKHAGEFAICFILMSAAITWIQCTSLPMPMLWVFGLALLAYMLYKPNSFTLSKISNLIRETSILALLMIIGYILYHLFGDLIRNGLADHEAWGIILSRLSLILFVMPFAITMILMREKPLYLAKGTWVTTIHFPWIFKGPLKDPIWRFMLIFLIITCALFSFFIDWGQPGLLVLVGYALSFALINSVLEELLWRGFILSHFVSRFGVIQGLIIAGTTFGLYHYHLGFSWPVCLLFSIFGIMMGGVAIRSQGLVPVMAMHFVMNILFVLSGMIL